MKKYILLSLLCVQVFTLSSKSMVEIWKTMPDSLLMLVDRTQRLEMPNFISMGLKGEVTNTLQGKSRMDTLTANYIHLTLTKSSSMQIKRLLSVEGDSILCVVKTWLGDAAESEVRFYNQDWNELEGKRLMGESELIRLSSKLLIRPDTMPQEDFDNLIGVIDPILVQARLFADRDELEVSVSQPACDTEVRRRLQSPFLLMHLNWNGKEYN